MNNNIWDILGIEETTDKKKIQQAYAEKVKVYHPEEFPEIFQQLQLAYKEARKYANKTAIVYEGSNVMSHKESQEERRYREKESIPDYILDLEKRNYQELYKDDIAKFVILLEDKLIGSKSKKDIKEVEELFYDNRFRTVLSMEEFRVQFESVMEYYQVWNQKVLCVLRKNVQWMMSESGNADTGLVDLKHYLDSKIRKEESHGIEIFVSILIILSAIFIVVYLFIQSDEFALRRVLPKETICQMVYDKYGITIKQEDIFDVEIKRDYILPDMKPVRMVEYHISYQDDEKEYNFVAKHPLKKKDSEININLEYVLFEQYLEAYFGDDVLVLSDSCYEAGITLFLQLDGIVDQEIFMEKLVDMLDNFFEDPYMINNEYEVNFQLMLNGEINTLNLSINKDNWKEACNNLSEELYNLVVAKEKEH